MACLSTMLEAKILKQLFLGESPYVPSDLYLALCLNQPVPTQNGSAISEMGTSGVDGGGHVIPTGYVRQEIANWDYVQVSTVGEVTNSDTITFPPATYVWPIIQFWAICSDVTGGDLLYWGKFTHVQNINLNQQFILEPEGIKISIS